MPYNPKHFVGRYGSHFEANCVTIVHSGASVSGPVLQMIVRY